MLGYYEDPELTRKAFRNGHFMTGNSGCMDRHGYLHIAGRKKDIIVTSTGKNIYPEEIEIHFTDTEYIKEIVISGNYSLHQG